MTRDMLRRRADLLSAVVRALDGGYCLGTWGMGERTNNRRLLADVGVVLVTATRAKKLGLRIKRGAVPVAQGYFGAPIQAYADLFVLDVQTAPARRKVRGG